MEGMEMAEVDDAQVNWGSNDDPRGLLNSSETYEVLRTDVHSWHTKIILKKFPTKSFNSVHFEVVKL